MGEWGFSSGVNGGKLFLIDSKTGEYIEWTGFQECVEIIDDGSCNHENSSCWFGDTDGDEFSMTITDPRKAKA